MSRAAASFGILLCLRRRQLLRSGKLQHHMHSIGIKYGKYCGVGYWGCAGEKPCDDLDACCMAHDNCVDKFGMTHVKCHKRLKNCLTRELKSGKVGFSKECPYSRAAPTMIRGMDLAILLSQLGDFSVPH
ncbi:Putative phospholipase A2 like 1 [Glycine soja]|nr:Putative phospholipase A2 like 1 [Glycine soja]